MSPYLVKNPQTTSLTKKVGIISVTVNVSYFPNQEVVIDYNIIPKNTNVSACIKVDLLGQGKQISSTPTITVNGNGTVSGVGDTRNGIRFRKHKHEIERTDEARISVFAPIGR